MVIRSPEDELELELELDELELEELLELLDELLELLDELLELLEELLELDPPVSGAWFWPPHAANPKLRSKAVAV